DGILECEEGTCDNNANCVPSNLPDGSGCDDYNSCTDTDICGGGVCAGTNTPNCTTYFEELFENGCPPGGWTLNPDWQCGVPTSGPGTAYSGTDCIATNLGGDYAASLNWGAAYAETPPIDLSSSTEPVLSFYAWWDTEGSIYDGFNVKVSNDNGQSFVQLGSVDPPYTLTIDSQPAWGGHQAGDGWQFVLGDLLAYQGDTIILRFDFTSDSIIEYPGVFIDEVRVSEAASVPLAITTVDPLPNGLEDNPYSVFMTKTGGSNGSEWTITGGSNHNWLSIDINTGELWGTPLNANVGPGTVTIHVEEPLDPNNFDDVTFNFDVIQVVTSLPWLEDFEGACPNGWTLSGDWQCGAPTSGPNAAYSGAQALATNLSGDYNNGLAWGTTYADSPPIDLSSSSEPVLGFWAWWDTEGSVWDGFNVKVSTDGGQSFTQLMAVTPPYTLTIDSQECWGGHESAAGWQFVVADLLAYQGDTIILRIEFRTDGSGTYPGVYVDDVWMGEAASLPVAITTPDPLPDAPADAAYSHFMARTGGSSNTEWTITGGSNHGWLGIDIATGELNGTPLAANLGPVTVTIHIEEPADPSNFDDVTFNLDVTPLTITSVSPLPAAYDSYPYAFTMTWTGGGPTTAWSITGGSNHLWLGIDAVTGELTGTPAPANVGPATVTVRVEETADLANFDEQTFDLDVVTVVWVEDFETCPNGWTFGGDWQCGTPTSGPGSAYSGTQCIATQLAGNYNIGQAWLTTTANSPSIDLTTAVSPLLTWRVWLHTEGFSWDGTNLKISIDNGQSWQLVTTVTPAYFATVDSQQCWNGDESALGWQLFEADLSAYVGETVML
ncbi:MAG: immune inhibitor A, partial [Deltaproteobacteria bacterium]|nr:immune inhibitor A [Deltaproteobacteria bacterium]